MGEAEPLEGHEGPQAGYEVEEPWYEGVTQDIGQGGRHFSLLLTQLLNSIMKLIPDSDPNPAIFVPELQDANKKLIIF